MRRERHLKTWLARIHSICGSEGPCARSNRCILMVEDCLVYNINLVVSIVIRTQDIHDPPKRHPVGRARAGRGTKTRPSVTDAGPTHALLVRNAGKIA